MEKSNKNREILEQISSLLEQLRAEPEVPNTASGGRDTYRYSKKFDLITLLYELQGARNEAFGKEVFKDTGWHLLLEVFRLDSKGKQIHVSALCAASRRSQTTALRFLAELEAAGLIIRTADRVDRRRICVTLTDEARRAMQYIALRLTATQSVNC